MHDTVEVKLRCLDIMLHDTTLTEDNRAAAAQFLQQQLQGMQLDAARPSEQHLQQAIA
jgi:hypothetical protein